jgi:hypothetical protein
VDNAAWSSGPDHVTAMIPTVNRARSLYCVLLSQACHCEVLLTNVYTSPRHPQNWTQLTTSVNNKRKQNVHPKFLSVQTEAQACQCQSQKVNNIYVHVNNYCCTSNHQLLFCNSRKSLFLWNPRDIAVNKEACLPILNPFNPLYILSSFLQSTSISSSHLCLNLPSGIFHLGILQPNFVATPIFLQRTLIKFDLSSKQGLKWTDMAPKLNIPNNF